MGISLFLALVLIISVFSLYVRLNLLLSSAALIALLAFWTYYGAVGNFGIFLLWVVLLALLVPLNTPFIRQIISARVLAIFKKLMPAISQTEREALDAGTVWWEGELFSGKPRWEKLLSHPKSTLTDEEKAFLDGPAEKLCDMLDDWEITESLRDLPDEVWDFIKKEKFLGMIIPKEYGGLEFSARAHSEVVMKLASRSVTAAVNVMVPSSLGPAELLLHYGTDEQKKSYLPGLAVGDEVPCFALTEPQAGSDAGSITSNGVVQKGEFGGKEVIGIKLNWDKRYITLSSAATVMGLAFKLHDPEHLIGEKEDIGITVALIPTNLPGIEIGRRHDPLNIPFLNGPIQGKDVFIPVEFIVGGNEQAGKGWRMLMERLAIGRGISLPSLSTAAVKLACRGTGGYARIRKQFRLPVGRFEGVEEFLGEIAGNAYIMDAARLLTVSAIDAGECPALVTAIAKYNLTERMRTAVNHAMDIQGGSAIVLGPRNFMGRVYQSVPISITVEGANILTRTLIVFGQGVIRAHPHVFNEMMAAADSDHQHAVEEFDKAFFWHVGFTASNTVRSIISGLTFGLLLPSPVGGASRRYFQQVGRMSSAFAFTADLAMLLLGANLRRKEKLSGRLADVLSELYLASAALKKFEDDGRPDEDLPLLIWACEDSLYKMQEQLSGFLDNLPNKWISLLLRLVIFPLGRSYSPPSDYTGHKAAELILKPCASRDRLTDGMHVSKNLDEPLGRIEDALPKVIAAEPIDKKVSAEIRSGNIKESYPEQQIEDAASVGAISAEEKVIALSAEKARLGVITVDDFPREYWENFKKK